MLRLAPIVLGTCAALAACSSPKIRGADVAEPGREPPGRLVASYRAAECKDLGGGAPSRSSRVYLVDTQGGARVLVESGASRDSLVVHDRHQDGTNVVYQALLDDGDGHRVVHDYRVPADGHGDGWMALATSFSENDSAAPLHAKLGAAAVTCKLLSDEPQPSADAGPPEP
jgi:hypothetical protein